MKSVGLATKTVRLTAVTVSHPARFDRIKHIHPQLGAQCVQGHESWRAAINRVLALVLYRLQMPYIREFLMTNNRDESPDCATTQTQKLHDIGHQLAGAQLMIEEACGFLLGMVGGILGEGVMDSYLNDLIRCREHLNGYNGANEQMVAGADAAIKLISLRARATDARRSERGTRSMIDSIGLVSDTVGSLADHFRRQQQEAAALRMAASVLIASAVSRSRRPEAAIETMLEPLRITERSLLRAPDSKEAGEIMRSVIDALQEEACAIADSRNF